MASAKGSSFVRKGKFKGGEIPGTKAVTQNSQLHVSSGVPSFDSAIGGGLPVGALVLLDEDINGTFTKLFMKYFLAEGILSGQAVLIGSNDINPQSMVKQLPGAVKDEASDETEDVADDKMKIAWRYQNMKISSPSSSSSSNVRQYFGHYFDLSTTLPSNAIETADISYWSAKEVSKNESFENSDFNSLLQCIKEKLKNGSHLCNTPADKRKICRLGLLQIGSPLWPKSEEHIPLFLYCLRALVRNSFSICMITVPFHLYQNKALREKCIHLSDICIQLQSFSGTELEENVALRDYSGFFRILKWAAMNCLTTGASYNVDLALKLRRRKLVIEKLHLPPDLEDSGEGDPDGSGGFGCGSSRRALLEF